MTCLANASWSCRSLGDIVDVWKVACRVAILWACGVVWIETSCDGATEGTLVAPAFGIYPREAAISSAALEGMTDGARVSSRLIMVAACEPLTVPSRLIMVAACEPDWDALFEADGADDGTLEGAPEGIWVGALEGIWVAGLLEALLSAYAADFDGCASPCSAASRVFMTAGLV